MDTVQKKEISEAVSAGEQAVSILTEIEKALSSALHWGIADILGGGLLVDLVKHSRLDKAKALFQKAGEAVSKFQKELGDVQMVPEFNLEISNSLYTFDVFFDNVFSDVLVQSKIEESLEQVRKLRAAITDIVNDLKNR